MRSRGDGVELFGRMVTLVEDRDLARIVVECSTPVGQRMIFCNVHMLMLSTEDAALATAMDRADRVFADGVPVAWLQRRVSGHPAQVIRGYEVMLAACERAARNGESIGLFGSSHEVLVKLERNLLERFPGLVVAVKRAPPFAPGLVETPMEELQSINASGVNWLFVGLGCPKQEKWIDQYGAQLDCHLLGVGAAFDWLAGTRAKPPVWMERIGLAWLFRLAQDPARMWHRYFYFNSKFILRSFKLLTWDRLVGNRAGGANS